MDISSLLEVEVKEGKPSDLQTNGEIAEYQNIPDFSIRDIASVRFRKLHCTACDVHIGSAPSEAHNMHEHPVLHVLLCTNCRNFYGDGTFEQGEDATDMFCRWCANGGNLYCCSYCSNTFCLACIKRNFDPLVRKKIERDEKWKCFVCNPADLYSARASCWALLQHVQTVTRILQSDRKMNPKEIAAKMDLDESQCCPHKVKRKRLDSPSDDETDETYSAPKKKRRKILSVKRPSRGSIKIETPDSSHETSTAEPENSPRQSDRVAGKSVEGIFLVESQASRPKSRQGKRKRHTVNPAPEEATRRQPPRRLRSTSSSRSFDNDNSRSSDHEDDIPTPLLNCDQSMIEGSESLTFENVQPPGKRTANNSGRSQPPPQPPQRPMGISPIPTANLMKKPMALAPGQRIQNSRIVRTADGSPVLVRKLPMHLQMGIGNAKANTGAQSVPMVSIPSRNHTVGMPQPPGRISVIQSAMTSSAQDNNSLPPLRMIRPRFLIQKRVAPARTAEPPKIIDLESEDEDQPTAAKSTPDSRPTEKNVDANSDLSTTTFPVRPDDGLLTIMTPTSTNEQGAQTDPGERQSSVRLSEQAIVEPTKSIDTVLNTLKTKLKKVLESAMLFPPDKELMAARAKTKAITRTIKRTVAELTSLNENLIRAYQDYKRECNEEEISHTPTITLGKKEESNKIITLDMECSRESEPEVDDSISDEDTTEDRGHVTPIKEFKPFRRRVHRACEARPDTIEKGIQVYQIDRRDYEKSIGYALLLKADYDAKRERNVLRPVVVPDENFGKYEEEFINYLQHIEDHGIETEESKTAETPSIVSVNDLLQADITPTATPDAMTVDFLLSFNDKNDEIKEKEIDENVEILEEHLEILTTKSANSSGTDSDASFNMSDHENLKQKKKKRKVEIQRAENENKSQKADNEEKDKQKTEDEKNNEIQNADEKKDQSQNSDDKKKDANLNLDDGKKNQSPNSNGEKKNVSTNENKEEEETVTSAVEEKTVLAVRALIEGDSSENSNSNTPALSTWKPVDSDDECTILE